MLTLYFLALLQLALVYFLAAASWRWAGWLWPAPNWGERLIVAGLLFCATAVLIVITLGVIGLLQPWLVAVVVFAWWCWSRWKAPAAPALPKIQAPPQMRWPLLLCVIVALPFLLRALVLVPLAWDGLTYHLYFPAKWIQTQRVSIVDGVYPYNYLAFYPKHYELIETFLMVVVRNDVFAKLLNLPLMALTALVSGLLCYRLCTSRFAGWCTGCFVFTIPAMLCWAATTYVEPLLNFAILSAVYFIMSAWKSEPAQLWRSGLLAGVALGLAAGTKYSATYVVAVLCVIAFLLLLVRRPGWRLALQFSGAFAGGGILIGVWWFAYNAVLTGNPVYPVPLGPLPGIIDPERPSMDSVSIWTHFGVLWQSGLLWRVWMGNPPPPDNLWGVGPDLVFPTQMGMGLKIVLLAPLLVFGLAFCMRRGWHLLKQKDLRSVAVVGTALASLLALLYTYLKLPFWGDIGSLFCQVRFAIPFVCLLTALGFCRLADSSLQRWLPHFVIFGAVLDALVLDLRIPGWNRLLSLLLLFIIGYLLYRLSTLAVPRRVVLRTAAVIVVVGLFPLLHFRESNRYLQWALRSEVHSSVQGRFAEAAHLLQHKHPRATAAYAGDFVSFLYLFVGPQMDRPICYVPTFDGPAATYLKQGALRDELDRAAWEKNLLQSDTKLLITFRFCDRQSAASFHWPVEFDWANDLSFPVLYENDYCCIHQIRFQNDRAETLPP